MNSETPLVSICCITYNHEKYIRECIEGFLMQKTSFPIEILIYDDASTDKTQEIIKYYANDNQNIISFLQTENQWQHKRYGLIDWLFPAAKGKYIALCEGDDYWTDPLKLQRQVDFLEVNQSYNICFTYSSVIGDSATVISGSDKLTVMQYTQYDILIGKKYQTRTATILARSFALKTKFNNKIHNGDTWFKIMATRNSRGIVLPFNSAVYRIHQGGVWSTASRLFQSKIMFLDWAEKLKYALMHNYRAVLPIVAFFCIAFIKLIVLYAAKFISNK